MWRKQRHTAHRIWQRLRDEHPQHPIGEATVREYVRDRKIEMDIQRREIFVPQTYAPAQEGQIDWFEGDVRLAGQLRRMQIFGMRSMYSGGAFHRAYTNATQQAFLEGHEHGFAYFGGVFHLLRFDNLSAAVKRILQGHQREETQRVIAFRSHWGFQSDYCNPGAGHEKGGVEGEVGRFRRNCLVPVPGAGDMERLNQLLLERCRLSERRTIDGRATTVREAMTIEHPCLLPLADQGFEIEEILFPVVNGSGCVRVKTNSYSSPLPAGARPLVKAWPLHVDIYEDLTCVATHTRCYGRGHEILNLEHYLDVLEQKPGAMYSLHTAGAMARRGPVAGVSRRVLERTRSTVGQESRDAGNDCVGARRTGRGLGSITGCRPGSAAAGSERPGGGAAHSPCPGPGSAALVRAAIGRRARRV